MINLRKKRKSLTVERLLLKLLKVMFSVKLGAAN